MLPPLAVFQRLSTFVRFILTSKLAPYRSLGSTASVGFCLCWLRSGQDFCRHQSPYLRSCFFMEHAHHRTASLQGPCPVLFGYLTSSPFRCVCVAISFLFFSFLFCFVLFEAFAVCFFPENPKNPQKKSMFLFLFCFLSCSRLLPFAFFPENPKNPKKSACSGSGSVFFLARDLCRLLFDLFCSFSRFLPFIFFLSLSFSLLFDEP